MKSYTPLDIMKFSIVCSRVLVALLTVWSIFVAQPMEAWRTIVSKPVTMYGGNVEDIPWTCVVGMLGTFSMYSHLFHLVLMPCLFGVLRFLIRDTPFENHISATDPPPTPLTHLACYSVTLVVYSSLLSSVMVPGLFSVNLC